MFVLVENDPAGGLLCSLDRSGICHSDSIDDALIFESHDELNAFLNYLTFYLGMDYSYYYIVVEL